LLTVPGEKVNRPDFGAGLMRQVFEQTGRSTTAALQLEVRAALQQTLRDVIQVEDMNIGFTDARFDVVVVYRLLIDGRRRTSRYEFNYAAEPKAQLRGRATATWRRPRRAAAQLPPTENEWQATAARPLPWIDYVAKDYHGFRDSMLSRVSAWKSDPVFGVIGVQN